MSTNNKSIFLPRMHSVDSSNIHSIGYIPKDRRMFVRFKKDLEVYSYEQVSLDVYNEFFVAESKGQYFLKNIKEQFTTNWLGVIDTVPIEDIDQRIMEHYLNEVPATGLGF